MRAVLADIQDGSFAERWIDENETGGDEFERLRQADRDHQIEQVGARAARPDAVPQPGRGRGRPGAGRRRPAPRGQRSAHEQAPYRGRAGRSCPAGTVRIFDTTLRDGEQAPGAGPDRRREARGRPPAGAPQGRRHRGRLPGRLARRLRGGPADRRRRHRRTSPSPRWRAAATATRSAPSRRIKVAHKPHLHVFIATSDIHLKHKLRIDPRDGARRGGPLGPLRPRAARPRRRDRVQRRGRLAHRHRLPAAGLRGGRRGRRVHGEHPGHRRLRDPGRVRRTSPRASSTSSASRRRSASTATTTSASPRPTRSPRSRPAPARSRSRSTASASAPATRRSKRS